MDEHYHNEDMSFSYMNRPLPSAAVFGAAVVVMLINFEVNYPGILALPFKGLEALAYFLGLIIPTFFTPLIVILIPYFRTKKRLGLNTAFPLLFWYWGWALLVFQLLALGGSLTE